MNDDGPTHNPDDILRRMLGVATPSARKYSAEDVLELLNRINSPTYVAEREKLVGEFKSLVASDSFQDDAARGFAQSIAKAFFQK